jgi:hypothetical protein
VAGFFRAGGRMQTEYATNSTNEFCGFFVALNHILKSQNSGDREAM